MPNTKTSLSNSSSVEELGEFWDSHDLGDFEASTAHVSFEVALEEPVFLFSVERGVSPETLLNLWLQERVAQEAAS